MESMQVRIDEKNFQILNELAEMLSSSRSEVIRRVIEGGIKELRMKIAMEKYIDDEFTLCRAAEFSGVSIQKMAKYLSDRGIPFFKQSVEDAKRDAVEAQSWL
jgi:predicted HTH domain antitoxin